MKVNLLVVEDDEAVKTTWARAIQRHNERRGENDLEFTPIICGTPDEAKQTVISHAIHCVITDLHLNGITAQGGREVIDQTRKFAGAPIAIMSGYTQDYDEENQDYAPIKIFEKTSDNYAEVIKWINSLSSMIRVSSMTQQRIQEITAGLFHKSLWKNWIDGELQQKLIDAKTRHLLTQISEEMISGSFASTLWPEEYYVRPSLRSRILTGDLIKINDSVYVVVSPPCDLANTDTPESIILSLCESTLKTYADEIIGKENNDKTREKMRRYLNQEKMPPSSHFLPKYKDIGPWFASFKKLRCITRDELTSIGAENFLGWRIASISPLFVPNLTHRFSSYLGRPGQPDIDPATALSETRPDT